MRKRNPLVDDDKYNPNRKSVSKRPWDCVDPEAAIGHTTGGSIVAKAKVFGKKFDSHKMVDKIRIAQDPFLAAVIAKYAADYYSRSGGSSTHYLIGWYGELHQPADEDKRAWSAGIKKHRLAAYKKGFDHWSKFRERGGRLVSAETNRYEYWKLDYEAIVGRAPTASATPHDAFRGSYGPDFYGISIDFLAPPWRNGMKGPDLEPWGGEWFTKFQIAAANLLLRDLCEEYGWGKLDRSRYLPHSFTDPMNRSWFKGGKGIGWDPGPIPYDKLLDNEGYFPFEPDLIV